MNYNDNILYQHHQLWRGPMHSNTDNGHNSNAQRETDDDENRVSNMEEGGRTRI